MNINMALLLSTESERLIENVQNCNIFYWDWELKFLGFLQECHTSIMDTIMTLFTHLGDAGIIWMLLTLTLLIIPKTRKAGHVMFLSLLFSLLIVNIGVKPMVLRCRPMWLEFFTNTEGWKNEIISSVNLLVDYEKDFSFPSGHTSSSFAAAVGLFACMEGKKKWYGVYALIVATIIAFSRLYVFAHWPTDVICGLIIGVICGILGYFAWKGIEAIINKVRSNKAVKA